MSALSTWRRLWRAILAVACLIVATSAWAAELVQPVPTTSPAYAQLRTLALANMLPTAGAETRADLLLPQPTRTLTRYDIASLIVEPLEQLVALVEAQDSLDPTPAQRRRFELALRVLGALTPADANAAFAATGNLLSDYHDAVETIAPGLVTRGQATLAKLAQPRYRIWQKADNTSEHPAMPRWRLSSVGSSMWRDPLVPASIMPGRTTDANTTTDPKTVTSYAAAMDMALSSRFRLYSAVAVLPGPDTLTMDSGKARLGLEVSLFRIRDFGITGILEYNVTTSGEATAPIVNSGATGGFGVVW